MQSTFTASVSPLVRLIRPPLHSYIYVIAMLDCLNNLAPKSGSIIDTRRYAQLVPPIVCPTFLQTGPVG